MTLRRILIAVPAMLVIAVVAAGAFWWFFVREDNSLATSAPAIPADLVAASSPSPAAGASSTSGATAASADGSLTFTIISARSEAAYFAGETLASVGLPSTAKGSTTAITGAFHLEQGGSLDPSAPSAFTVDLRTLKSDKSMRDDKVQNIALATSTYPTATFTAKSVSGWDPAVPSGQEQTLKLTGTLDLHGVKKDVTWDVKARRDGTVITALATLNFKYADFNIPILNIGGFVSVQDNVTLQVQVVAQQAGG
jgi:polyisoprenoid-binding protein YceI